MERYIDARGAKIWTDMRGKAGGKCVLLCNGGPGCCDYLQPVSEMIEDGYSVIRFEQRGCGRSDKDGKYDLETTLGDIEAIREYYQIDSWIIGGHSWGANLALIWAMAHPEHTEAILYIAGNGLQRNREWSAEYHAKRETIGEVMPEMRFAGSDEVNRAGNLCYQRYIQRPTLFKDISELNMDALFLCAGKDIRPNWPTQQIYALMRNAKLKWIDDAAHFIWLTHYDEMRAVLREFLQLS